VPDERGQLRGEIVIAAAAKGNTVKTGEFAHVAQFSPVYEAATLREF